MKILVNKKLSNLILIKKKKLKNLKNIDLFLIQILNLTIQKKLIKFVQYQVVELIILK